MAEKKQIEKLYCSACGSEKSTSQFYTSNSPKYANDNYKHKSPFCKQCCKNLIYKNNKVDKVAFQEVLKNKLDVPFFNELYLKALNDKRETVGAYITLLNTYQPAKEILRIKKTLSYSDGEIEEENKDEITNITNDVPNNEKTYSKKWSGNYTQSEIDYLDEYLKGLDNDFKIITTNHKDYAKKIAQASLAVNKAYQDMLNGEAGADKRYKDLQATFDTLSKSAQFSENARSANDVGITGIAQIVDKVETKQWIYESEEFDKDDLDHILEQFANINKSV